MAAILRLFIYNHLDQISHTDMHKTHTRAHTHSEIPKRGGVQKKAISEEFGGCLKRFFPGGLSKVGG